MCLLSSFVEGGKSKPEVNIEEPRRIKLLRTTIITEMKAYVYVTLKASVLDPQGQTIHNALRKMGHADVESVRQGKYFILSLANHLTPEAAQAEVETIAKGVLTNPVIEDFTYRIEI